MASDIMEDWCADHRFVAPARLDGFALLFLRRSTRWKAGAADVVEADGAATWGALYEVSAADLDALDAKEFAAEGGYRRRTVEVATPDGERHSAVTYEVVSKEPQRARAQAGVRRAASTGSKGTRAAAGMDRGPGGTSRVASPNAQRPTPNALQNDEGRPDLRDALLSHRDWFHRGGGLSGRRDKARHLPGGCLGVNSAVADQPPKSAAGHLQGPAKT